MDKKLISIVIPCYRSERSIREVVELTMAEFKKMERYDCEFVLVNDCSPDDTFGEIRRLAEDYPCVHGLNLMRNFGQHNGLMCGMNYAKGDYIVGMDDDLQTHPSQLPKIIAKMEEGYDLVYGVYRDSKNGGIKNFTSWLNKVTSRILLGRPKGIRSSNFWMITDKVKDVVIRYKGHSPYVDGLFYQATHKIANVEIEHHKREYGSSNYTLKKLMKQWIAYFNYSLVPLRIATVVGILMAGVGFVSGLVTLIRKILDPSTVAGWASIVCILLVFFGIVLLVLGVIGEYIGDILLSTNNTPQYIVRDAVNVAEEEKDPADGRAEIPRMRRPGNGI